MSEKILPGVREVIKRPEGQKSSPQVRKIGGVDTAMVRGVPIGEVKQRGAWKGPESKVQSPKSKVEEPPKGGTTSGTSSGSTVAGIVALLLMLLFGASAGAGTNSPQIRGIGPRGMLPVQEIRARYKLLGDAPSLVWNVTGNGLSGTATNLPGRFLFYTNDLSRQVVAWTNSHGKYLVQSFSVVDVPGLAEWAAWCLKNSATPESTNADSYFMALDFPFAGWNGADIASAGTVTVTLEGGIYVTNTVMASGLDQLFWTDLVQRGRPIEEQIVHQNSFGFTSGRLNGYRSLTASQFYGLSAWDGDTYASVPGCRDKFSLTNVWQQVAVYASSITNPPGFFDNISGNSTTVSPAPAVGITWGLALGFVDMTHTLFSIGGGSNVWGTFGPNITNALSRAFLIQNGLVWNTNVNDVDAFVSDEFAGTDYWATASMFLGRSYVQAAEMAGAAGDTNANAFYKNKASVLASNAVALLFDPAGGLFLLGTNATHRQAHDVVASAMAVRWGLCYAPQVSQIMSNFALHFWDGSQVVNGSVYFSPTNEVNSLNVDVAYHADDYAVALEKGGRWDLARTFWGQWMSTVEAAGVPEWGWPANGAAPNSAWYSVSFLKPYGYVRGRAGL